MHPVFFKWRSRAGRSLITAAVSFAMYWQLRLAAADYMFHRDTLDSVVHALRLAPENVAFLDRLAALDIAHAPQIREREVQLQPSLSRIWVELATRAEFDGDLKRAEHLFLRASEVDRMWLPRWALTNFYFRRDSRTEFWKWARRSASYAYDDPGPLFDLSMQVTNDAWEVQRQLSIETPPPMRAYVNYLRSNGRLKDAGAMARMLVRTGTPSTDLSLLLSMIDQLIDNGEANGARTLWNDLNAAGWVVRGAIDPMQPVTNPELRFPFMGRDFDWRILPATGVTMVTGPNGRGLSVTFSGAQNQACTVLEQILPVQAGKVYALVYESTSETPVGGLTWLIRSVGDGNQSLATIPLKADGSGGPTRFAAPSNATLIRLQLVYARPLASPQLDGSIRIARIAMNRLRAL